MTARHITDELAALIADYRHCAAAFERVDPADPARDAAGAAVIEARNALLDHRPAALAEFHAKFVALIPATRDDSECYILRHLAEDIINLMEGGR